MSACDCNAVAYIQHAQVHLVYTSGYGVLGFCGFNVVVI
jgi:hypothetical protein